MKSKFFILVGFVLYLITAGQAAACVAPPSIMAGPMCNVAFDAATQANKTAVEQILNDNRDNCGLTPEDIAWLAQKIANGYSAVKQSQAGYETLLKDAQTKNAARPKECPSYLAMTRQGDWTALIFTDVAHSQESGCAVEKCDTVTVKVVENAL